MSVYGLRVSDSAGNSSVITPKVGTIISSGRATLSNSLETDNTYGKDIDLPGTAAIPQANISVLIVPVNFTYKITGKTNTISGHTQRIGYMDSAQTYYKHAKSTGVMTSWTAGNLTAKTTATYDHICAMFPVAFWDLKGGTTFTAVRLFAATCYLAYDSSASAYIKVYSIGSDGVSEIDYVVSIKNWDYL